MSRSCIFFIPGHYPNIQLRQWHFLVWCTRKKKNKKKLKLFGQHFWEWKEVFVLRLHLFIKPNIQRITFHFMMLIFPNFLHPFGEKTLFIFSVGSCSSTWSVCRKTIMYTNAQEHKTTMKSDLLLSNYTHNSKHFCLPRLEHEAKMYNKSTLPWHVV